MVGVRWFTPYMFNLDLRIDNQLRPQIGIAREIMIFPRTMLFGEFEYQADFGWVNDLNKEKPAKSVNYKEEITWSAGVEYLLSKKLCFDGQL